MRVRVSRRIHAKKFISRSELRVKYKICVRVSLSLSLSLSSAHTSIVEKIHFFFQIKAQCAARAAVPLTFFTTRRAQPINELKIHILKKLSFFLLRFTIEIDSSVAIYVHFLDHVLDWPSTVVVAAAI